MKSLHDMDNWWHSLTEKRKTEIFKVYSEYSLVDYDIDEKPTVYTKHIDLNEKPIVPQWSENIVK